MFSRLAGTPPMLIRAACPHCNKRFRVDDRFAGKSAKCPDCGTKFTVAAADTGGAESSLPDGFAQWKPADAGATAATPLIEFEAAPLPTPAAPLPIPHAPAAPASTGGQKQCPMCAEMINAAAVKCRYCGTMLQTTGAIGQPQRVAGLIYPQKIPVSPVLVALLSGCCFAGLGQMVLGQAVKGIVLLLANIVLAVVTMGISTLISFPLLGLDAYLVARKLQSGQPVTQWESFPGA
jgi:predicted Zn finger-like uncharacterized protein